YRGSDRLYDDRPRRRGAYRRKGLMRTPVRTTRKEHGNEEDHHGQPREKYRVPTGPREARQERKVSPSSGPGQPGAYRSGAYHSVAGLQVSGGFYQGGTRVARPFCWPCVNGGHTANDLGELTMLDYWTAGERDYDEEEWQRREYEAEALAELEHERTCDGT